MQDRGNHFSSLSSNISESSLANIVAEKGIVNKKYNFVKWTNNFTKKMMRTKLQNSINLILT